MCIGHREWQTQTETRLLISDLEILGRSAQVPKWGHNLLPGSPWQRKEACPESLAHICHGAEPGVPLEIILSSSLLSRASWGTEQWQGQHGEPCWRPGEAQNTIQRLLVQRTPSLSSPTAVVLA